MATKTLEQVKVEEAVLGTITEMASQGWRQVDIARALRISRETWRRLRDEDPRVREAWDAGLGLEHKALVNALYENATKRHDTTAAIYLLNCRHGYVSGVPVESGEADRVRLTLEIPVALDPAKYARLVNGPEGTDGD